jgi:hypothetical protein
VHIAVDLDDVTVDFMNNVLDCFEREFGERPAFDGNTWGDSATALYKHPLFIAAGYKSWWDWLRERDWLWGIAPAVPGAIGGIKTLRAAGHYVEAVTSKPEWAEPQVYRWLGKWRPAFQRVTIVTTGQKKTDYTDADLIIDDKLETCAEFLADNRLAIWFHRPGYTSALAHDLPGGLCVATTWSDVVQIVKELA